jgi:hypothetical protein
MTRLPPWTQAVFFAVLTTCFASCLVSGISTLRAVGWTPEFPLSWLKAWMMSWPVAAPAMYVVSPPVRRMLARMYGEG